VYQRDVAVAALEEVFGGEVAGAVIVASNIVQMEAVDVVVDEDHRAIAVLESSQITVFIGDAEAEHAVYKVAVEELAVLALFDERGVGDLEKDSIAGVSGAVVDGADQFSEVDIGEGVAELGDEDGENAHTLGLEALGQAAGPITESVGGLEDATPGGLADARVSLVQDERNGRHGDTAFYRYVLDANGVALCH